MPAAVSTILTRIGDGEITPGEGAVLAGIVETQTRLVDAQQAEQSRNEAGQQGMALEAKSGEKWRRRLRALWQQKSHLGLSRA
jgi:hypothetical protein